MASGPPNSMSDGALGSMATTAMRAATSPALTPAPAGVTPTEHGHPAECSRSFTGVVRTDECVVMMLAAESG